MFGRALRSRCNRQRKLRRRGPQKLLASKSQRSKSFLSFGRRLCRATAWTRLSIRAGRGMQALNRLPKNLSLVATRR